MMKKRLLSLLFLAALVFAFPAGLSAAFVDVPADAYYKDAVTWAVDKNITNGMSEDRFSPKTACTRGQIVTFLWRYAGEPRPVSKTNPFVDVSPQRYYNQAVLWAYENGITSGTDASHFSPEAPCNRGQAVSFLYRFDGAWAVDYNGAFSDVRDNVYYSTAVTWAVDHDITNGTGGDRFSPAAVCDRAQIVTFLMRLQKSSVEEEWDGKPLLSFAGENIPDDEMLKRLNWEIPSLISDYIGGDGYQDHDDARLEASGRTVYRWAQSLRDAGLIEGCSYNNTGHTVGFFLPSGLTYVYVPNIRDAYSGGYVAEGFDELSSWHRLGAGALDQFQRLAGTEVFGSFGAVSYIGKEVDGYAGVSHEYLTVNALRDFLAGCAENNCRAIFWRGHGNIYTCRDNTERPIFFLHQKVSALDLSERVMTGNRVIVGGDEVAVSSDFFRAYLSEVNGGIFISGSCFTGATDDNGVNDMSLALISKGFDTYIGPDNAADPGFSDAVLGLYAQYLCEQDETDEYARGNTIGSAISKTVSKLGSKDQYGTSFIGFGDSSFRLLPSWEEAYAKLIRANTPSYGGTIQLADLDADGVPELLIGSRAGSGAFSQAAHVYTFKDNEAKELEIADPYNFFLSFNGIALSQNSAGEIRAEGTYVLRAGAGNYSTCVCVYRLTDRQAGMETVFVEDLYTSMSTGKSVTTYYQDNQQLSSKAAYQKAIASWRVGWQSLNNYVGAVGTYYKTPGESEIRDLIKRYNEKQ